MPRQLWLEDVVADAFRGVRGYRVDAYSGWRTRGNTSFEPVGVMNHHTGPGGYNNLLNYMMRGSSIAPLCNIATSRPSNGVVRITICTAGRANHAGRGGLAWTGTNNGNFRTIGIENQNSGSQAWPQQQVEGIRILTAALLRELGRPATRAVDHKTYAPGRKVDRFATNVAEEQRIIGRILSSGGTVAPTPPPPAPVDPWEEFWMSLTDAEKKVLKDFAGEVVAQGTNGRSFARNILEQYRTIRDLVQRGNTSLQGVIIGGVNVIDAVRDLGYKIGTGERHGVQRDS